MNRISLCRPAPDLPQTINQDLIFVQMITLEHHLAETNPLLEEDLYMGLLEKLSGIYIQVNQFPETRKLIQYSYIRPEPEIKHWNKPKKSKDDEK